MDWVDRSVVVTGGAGFIGSHLVRKLLDHGARVHILHRAGSDLGRLGGLADQVTLHRCDLTDRAALGRVLGEARPTHVFHLAAEARANLVRSPQAAVRSLDDTVRPMIRLVETLAALPDPPQSFIRAGSGAEYGMSDAALAENSPENPVMAYGAAMLAGTKYLAVMAPELPFPCLTARLALTYGPDQSQDFLIARLVAASLAGREVPLQRPMDRRDLIHVDDVTDALLMLAKSTAIARYPVVNICSADAPTMRHVADLVADIARCSPEQFPNAGDAQTHAPRSLLMDNRLARGAFGWRPKVSLADGLAGLIADARMFGKEREIAGVR